MSQSVADIVNEAMARKHRPDGRPWGPYQLMGAIGLLEGDRPFNITQVQRLLSGERRTFDHQLITRLAEVLDLTEEETDELWFAARLWPPDLDVQGYRRLRQLAFAHGEKVTGWSPISPGQPLRVPVPADLDELVRRNRRLEAVAA